MTTEASKHLKKAIKHVDAVIELIVTRAEKNDEAFLCLRELTELRASMEDHRINRENEPPPRLFLVG